MSRITRSGFAFLFGVFSSVSAADLSLSPNNPGNTHLDTTRNGIPLVNIARPSDRGISHNRFESYNVDQKGLILNNATEITNTQLGGQIYGNANLGDNPAQKIINEVVSSRRSSLRGYTEVAGHPADVIVANPNGITCNGCGFINTPHATLTTGRPTISGDRVSLSVDGGDVNITGAGLNARNIDKLSIITQAVNLNANLFANKLEMITGSNDVDLKTGVVKSKGRSGVGVSIDSSALGGMYADRIKLVGTDTGVGVNLEGQVVAGVGGFDVTADGKISIKSVQSRQDIQVQSKSSSARISQRAYAKENLELKAKTKVSTGGSLSSGKRFKVVAKDLDNSANIAAGFGVLGHANGRGGLEITLGNRLENTGVLESSDTVVLKALSLKNLGLLKSRGALQITSSELDNASGSILAGAKANIQAAGEINNVSGKLHANGPLTLISARGIDNESGLLSSYGRVVLSAHKDIKNTAGSIIGDSGVDITGATLLNREGLILAGSKSKVAAIRLIAANRIENSAGRILASGAVKASADGLINRAGIVSANEDLKINAGTLDNTHGKLHSVHDLDLVLSTSLVNKSGQIVAGNNAAIRLPAYKNEGKIEAYNELALKATTGNLENTAELIANTDLKLDVGGELINSGRISSEGGLGITAQGLDNSSLITSGGNADLCFRGAVNNNGRISALRDLVLKGVAITNHGAINAGRDLSLSGASLINHKTLFSGRDMTLYFQSLLHNATGAEIYSNGDLVIAANPARAKTDKVLNTSATIEVLGDVFVSAKEFINRKAEFVKGKRVVSNTTATLIGQTVKRSKREVVIEAINRLGDEAYTEVTAEYSWSSQGPSYHYRYKNAQGKWVILDDYDIEHITQISPAAYQLTIKDEAKIEAEIARILAETKEAYKKQGYLTFLPDRGESVEGWQAYSYYYALDLTVPDKRPEEKQRKVTTRIEEEYVVKDSAPANFLAGGNLTIHADKISNYLGLLAADADVTLVGDSVDNQGEQLYRSIHKSGEYKYCYKKCKNTIGKTSEYTWAPLPSKTTHEVAGVAGYSTIQAGKNVRIQADRLTNAASATREHHAPLGLSVSSESLHTGGRVNKHSALSLHTGDWVNKHSAFVIRGTDGFIGTLPQDQYGLFITNPNPNHPYLIELNSEFTSYSRFISSSYIMDRLNLDGDKTIKRLGDAMYENRLIREQVFKATGRRYFAGLGSDFEQYKYLMDNALKAYKDLKLVFGVALTQEQINRLTQSIVWMEKHTVHGHEVLVPRVYIARADRDTLRGGQILAGGNIGIQAAEITNSGGLKARDNVILVAVTDIDNLGGSIRAQHGLAGIFAGGTLTNRSGTIAGHDVSLQARTIEIETATFSKDTQYAPGQSWSETLVDDKAKVTAKNAIDIVSLSDTDIAGADITSVPGSVNIRSVAGNVNVATARKHDRHDIDISGGYNRGESLEHVTSTIAGKEVRVRAAEGHIVLEGTQVNADESIDLEAQQIALISAHDYKYRDAYLKAKGSFLGGGKETQVTTRSTQVIRSALQARNVSTTSNTLQLVGSQINAEVADIKAETLKLVSDKNSDYRRVYEDSSGLITRTIEDEGYQRETAVSSTIAAVKLIFNGDELKRAAAVDELVTTLSSEHDLSPAQVETLKAQLNNQEWHHKTTTLSKLGAIIVQAVALAVAPGVADAALSGITNALLKTATRAAINSLSGQLTRQALTVAVTGGGAGFDLGGIVEGAIKAGLTAGLGFEADSLIATANLGEIGGHLGTIVTDAAIQSAVYGGNLADNILNAAIDDVSSFDAHKIGDMTDSATLTNIIAHAALGCGVGAALASDCAAGAAGAALSAVFAPQIAKGVDADGDGKNLSLDEKKQVRSLTQIVSALVAHAAGQNLDVSNYTTLNEVENNYLSHTEEQERTTLKARLKECKASGSCSTDEMQGYQASIDELDALDKARDQAFLSACGNDTGSAQCTAEVEKYLEIRDSWDGKFAEGVTGIREYTQSDLLLGQYVTLNRLKTQHPEIDPKAIDALAELDLPTAVAEVLDLPPEVVGIISMTNPKNWIKKGGQTIAKVVKSPKSGEILAQDGTKITGFTKHGVDRVIGDGAKRAGTRSNAILDAVKNPTKIKEGVDNQGRPFKIYTGKNARVVINPRTGKIISTNPLSHDGAHLP